MENDVLFSLNITLDKRVLPTELPVHLGKSTSLDEQIAAILQTGQAEQYYLDGEQLIGIPFPVGFDGENTTWVKLEIEGASSSHCYYPDDCQVEEDDERIITTVSAVFHDEHCQVLGQLEITDKAKLYEFQSAFDKEIYEVDLSDNDS